MRLLALPLSVLLALQLSIVPVSAQTVNPVTVTMTNTPGPIASCPVTVNFSATVTVGGFATGANREIQYKWLNSSGQDAPTQTLPVPIASTLVLGKSVPLPSLPVAVTATGSWTVGAGTYWEVLQVSYPANQTSPHFGFVVTCPTAGSLALQSAITGPIVPIVPINPVK